jgi:hypothetical protein
MAKAKVVVQVSQIRIDDDTTYRKGEIVYMEDDLIAKLGTSVRRLDEVNRASRGVSEAIEKKDAEIRALKAEKKDLELEVAALRAAAEPSKTAGKSGKDNVNKKESSPQE